MKSNQKNQGDKAFTLVETLVAVSIFSISILGLMSVLTNGITNTNYAKQKVAAGYLAQEGIEYIRNMRDTFVLYAVDGQTGWNSFVTKITNASCDTTDGCFFAPQSLDYGNPAQPMASIELRACDGSCPTLLYDGGTASYGYTPGADSGFARKVTTSQISADEIKISSTVSWTQASGDYEITFSESVFNWIQ